MTSSYPPTHYAEKLKLLEARVDEASAHVAEQTSQSQKHREALDVLTPQLEEALSRFQDDIEALNKKYDTQRERVAMNEGLLKELAATCADMHDSFDRKVRGVIYQLENP